MLLGSGGLGLTLVSMAGMLKEARREGYAIGGFDAWDLELVRSVIDAAEAERSPVIVLVGKGGLEYCRLEYYSAFARMAAERASVPVALHLDHASSLQLVVQCIRQGFSSVMFDGSAFPVHVNIELTKKVVDTARAMGVSVESEVGRVPEAEAGSPVEVEEASMTDPNEALRFVGATGVDALAVSVGTVHGLYNDYARLDFDRLRRIRDSIDIPLVLHGGTGMPDGAVREAIQLGVCKINIGTALKRAFISSLRGTLGSNSKDVELIDVLASARLEVENTVRGKIRLFRSDGRAR